MAIWPFGRKGKRPRSLMKVSDAADRRLSFEDAAAKSIASDRAAAGKKPPRKRSKREKRRSASLRRQSPPRVVAAADGTLPVTEGMSFAYQLDNHTSYSSLGQDNIAVARLTPTLQKRSSTNGRGSTLKKRLSKRSARELEREQEIKALSSSTPANFHRSTVTWGYLPSDVRRGPSVRNRYVDHHQTSNQSLPMGSQSSLSDSSDVYTYKVNAFAVLAPRPIIRYSETHSKYLPPRSTNPSSNSMRKDININEAEDWNSHKRVAELADDLDAPALRELMERDRRRREKKRLHDQEKKQRRLLRKLEREQEKNKEKEKEKAEESEVVNNNDNNAEEIDIDDLRGRDKTPSPATSARRFVLEDAVDEEQQTQRKEEESLFVPDQSGSWLREPSRDSQQLQQNENRLSDITAHVIGNIDDRSLRASKLGHHTNTQLEDEVPRQQSPLCEAVASTSSAHISSLAQESISDLSRSGNSEKRSFNTNSRRKYSWIAFFRRPSLRKRRSKDNEAPSSEFSNTSRDSFMKTQPHYGAAGLAHAQSMPIPISQQTSFRRTGTVYRSQSKFVEHLGDQPISPPNSFMQSSFPIALEPVADIPAADEVESGPSPPQSYTDGDEYNYENNDERSRQTSWDEKSGVHPQSLASIDSEGSWMSGKYLRRISHQNPNFTSWRDSTGKNKLDKYDEAEEHEEDVSNEDSNRLTQVSPENESDSINSLRQPSSAVLGLDPIGVESVDSRRSSTFTDNVNSPRINSMNSSEAWHGDIGRRPMVVRHEPRVSAISKEIIFGDYDILDMDDGDVSPISPISQDNDDIEVQRATSVELRREYQHARQISTGSVKLLDIPPRTSVESPTQ